ncbi:MAG: tetratricopeptide repeat protein, partial [Cyclobacteriaceae bacterium]
MSTRRQLAAIMFTDIEGYTSLMQRDESAGVRMRNTHRGLFEGITHKYSGRILQYYGDGTLSIFDSAIEAVQCGIDLQSSFIEASIPVRIGIHLGDIIFDKDDIIGDGVNIASRIESLAKAGSVLISGKVYDEIKNKQDITTQNLGDFKLKNVDVITPVYALTSTGLVIPDKVGDAAKGSLAKAPASRSLTKYWWAALGVALLAFIFYLVNGSDETTNVDKSIAVLPFLNMSPDPEQDYFSDGITEDILSHLSTIEDLKVISRTTSWGYKDSSKGIPEIGRELGVDHILEGSVRRSGAHVRVVAQLIDVRTDEHILSQTYDREITEIFDIQTEIASEIANLLRTKLSPRALGSAGNPEITAYDYYLKGHKILREWPTQQDLDNAIKLLKQALIEDPDYAEAYADLALAYLIKGSYQSNRSEWVDSALILVNLAVDLSPRLPEAYMARAQIYESDLINDLEAAQKDFQKAYDLDPNNSDALLNVGVNYFDHGSFEKGIDLVIKSLEVEPDKTSLRIYVIWAKIYQLIDSVDQAIAYYQQAIKLKPNATNALSELVDLLSSREQYKEALVYAERIVKIDPTLLAQDNLAWTYLRS